MRILIVDDHPLVRGGVAQVFRSAFPDVSIVEAQSGAQALESVWSEAFDLVLLDLSLPGRSGLELLNEMKAARPKLPVLVFSGYPETQFAVRVLRAGAAGYVSKGSSAEVLLQAASRAMAGGKFVSPAVAEKLASELVIDPSKPPHDTLSNRENDVMLRLAEGKTVGQIAETLNLSVKTVSTYRSRILAKMHMESNAELIQYAIRNHLIE